MIFSELNQISKKCVWQRFPSCNILSPFDCGTRELRWTVRKDLPCFGIYYRKDSPFVFISFGFWPTLASLLWRFIFSYNWERSLQRFDDEKISSSCKFMFTRNLKLAKTWAFEFFQNLSVIFSSQNIYSIGEFLCKIMIYKARAG